MTKHKCLIVLASLLSVVSILPVRAAVELFPLGSEWRYRLGTNEASTPVDAWRAVDFDDSTWPAGPTPIGYGETDIVTTLPTDVAGNYTSVYVRKRFTVANPLSIAQLNVQLRVDDGLVVWINGVEVGRDNMAAGNLAYNARSVSAVEPHDVNISISTGVQTILVPGNNVIAVHYFNAPSASSDIYLNAALSYIEPDPIPPVISNVSPVPGTVNQLTLVTVTFSEPVANVDAFDLLVNGQFATTVSGGGATYTFLFPQPAYGPVQISWNPDHGITDLGIPPNPFDHTAPAASWQYTLVDVFAPFVTSIVPPAGSTVRSLNQIQVRFSEGVAGVDAADLVINGMAATGVTAISASEYAFTFPEPPVGTVPVAWATPTGIQDLAAVPNSFTGGSWTYDLNPTASSATLVISEFMASNGTPGPGEQSVMDEDGEYSDWIEIYNPGDVPVNLLGWALTDDPGNLNRWRFPETNLLAGQFMLIFASGKDRREPGAPLHTDFQLRTEGEYLALVDPDGKVVSEFSPGYPQQLRNVSYGFGFDSQTFTLVPSNAPVRVLVPASGSLGTNWVFPNFNDASWTSGTIAVGYDTGAQDPAEDSIPYAVLGLNPDGYYRFSETSGSTAANLGTLGAAANGTYTGTLTLGQPGPRPPAFGGFEPDNVAPRFSGDDSVNTSSAVLNNRSAFTMAGWINPAAAQAARTGLFGQNDAIEFGFIDSGTIQIWTPSGGSINVAYPFPSGQWHHVAVVGDGSSLRVYFDGTLAGSGGSPTASYGTSGFTFRVGGGGIFDASGNFFNGNIDEVVVYTRALNPTEILAHVQASGGSSFSYTSLIKTDVRSAMLGVNSSIYLRLPFQVTDPSLIDRLSLRIQYDDGFQAYLNGTPVAARNAPLLPQWNSVATARNADARAVQFEEINLSTYADLLQIGENILALHGLNFSATNVDFLVNPTLTATTIGTLSPSERYFTTPSPGDINGVGTQDLGPIIRDVVHTPQIPNDTDNLLVTAQFLPVFNRPLTSATLRYRFMFGGETNVPMTDDGLDGDVVGGDGIFSALIPAAANTSPGQMIRYYVTASDFAGNQSRWPLYDDKAIGGSEQYLGTVVNDPTLTSKLPIFQLFIENTQLGPIDTEGGGRVAVYYDGELYDNVYMELRGNTTAGYLKKSHRIQFPREHQFRHPGADGRVRNTSFQADYPDPSYMRQGLCYWLGNLIGCPSPFYYPVRLQTNGVFYQMANHNNITRGELSEYLGYDERGALYQAAGTIQPSQFSTGRFRKRTRLDEDNSDYQALAAGVAEGLSVAQRRINVCDQLDLPQVVNYLVIGRWGHENDDVWANMSLYRDTEGDKLWRIIPFDMNLSWGAIYYEGSNPVVIEGVQSTNDTHKAHPLYGGSEVVAENSGNYNRIYDVMFDVPEFRQMYLRRMRTMMDAYVKPPGTSPLLLPMEKHIREMHELMREEANRDRAKWGWPAKGGQCNFNPGISFDQGVQDMIDLFVNMRRYHFYVRHSVANTGFPVGSLENQNAGIPAAQPADAVIRVASLEVNPSSGNQNQEFICVTNPNPYAVDISGWKIDGAVNFTFKLGTVIPSNNVLYVSPDLNAFRARTTGPRGGQGLFVVGNYQGQLSARGESIEIFDDKGRGVSTNTYPGNPSAVQQYLRVTEIMYNPSLRPGTSTDAQNYEFIELKNTGPTTLNLAGVRFANGVTFAFTNLPAPDLAAGQTVVLVKNQAAFVERYGSGFNVAGQYGGYLDNAGERLRLLAPDGEEILDFQYDNAWYPITDGLGFSLVVVDETAEPDLWNAKSNWRPSGQLQGTPGAQDPGAPTFAPIVVNEVLTHTDLPQRDAVELYNPTDNDVNLGGWFISDDFTNALKFRIPNNTIIRARNYLFFDEDDFNPTPGVPPSFAFSSKGDEVFLLSGDPNGSQLTGYIDGFDFGAAENGVSFGRHTNSVGDVDVVALAQLTLNGPNSGPKVGPVVISEIMYRPPDVNGEDNAADEYIELQNVSPNMVPLFDPATPTNTWRLANAVDFTFQTNVTLPAGGRLVVVSFDPVDDEAAAASFRSHYGITPSVPLYGPFLGKLDNSDEQIDLLKPDAPELGEVPFVRVERVHYRDNIPWPPEADGVGPSLHRRVPVQYGNDPIQWVAAAPTPGSGLGTGESPVITVQPADANLIATLDGMLSVVATGTPTLRYQWQFNGDNIEGATGATLDLLDVLPEDAGLYRAVIYNTAGAVVSRSAQVQVVIPASFIRQPQSLTVRLGSNAVFSVQVSSTSSISYQWRFNGVPILGANSDTLAIANAQAKDDGLYDVEVTDAVATILSNPARLRVLINPSVVRLPTQYTVVQGGSVTLSVEAAGTLPMGYRWRRINTTLKNEVLNSYVSFFTLNNVQPSNGGPTIRYSVVLTNEAFFQPGLLSSNIFLTVLADADTDGLPDTWETDNGVQDPNLDKDGDGMTNREEYLAGTDPSDPDSYLRVERFSLDGDVQIEFTAVSNVTYSVEYKNALDELIWNKLTDVAASATNRTVVVTDPSPVPDRFYRLVTPLY